MLDTIKQPINDHLKRFEPYFKERMSTKVSLLNVITNYIYRRKGKQLRPIIVFLSAGLNGKIDNDTYVAAGMIELLHTATLIHDDVVDEAYERRGFLSINALWRSKVAVLVGDYLLSRGLLVAIENNQFELLRVMSSAVNDMSEGELLQIERSRKMNIDEPTYYEIIRKKTASLIASCCANGAISAGATAENVALMKEFGINLGTAFQIRDDLFDYQSTGLIGKPTGNDIKEKKLTLPLIYSLAVANPNESKRILNLIRHNSKQAETVSAVVDFVSQNGGIEYTVKQMNAFRDRSLEILKQFPESEFRNSLELLVNFVVERQK
ncbi:MAG: polyprenyl synthetase family protein [Bacteroidales bacterium]|nr:polyprenyl synthetase family protein [Bacteroidales bacterium]